MAKKKKLKNQKAVDRPSYKTLKEELKALEESLTLWERGEALARRCEEWLVGAKARLDAARAAAEES